MSGGGSQVKFAVTPVGVDVMVMTGSSSLAESSISESGAGSESNPAVAYMIHGVYGFTMKNGTSKSAMTRFAAYPGEKVEASSQAPGP